MSKFGIRLKELRTNKGISQEELSNDLKVSRSCIGNYEQGKRQPDFEDLERIADYFNVDMDYLVGKSDVLRKNSVLRLSSDETLLIEWYRNNDDAKQLINRLIKYWEVADDTKKD